MCVLFVVFVVHCLWLASCYYLVSVVVARCVLFRCVSVLVCCSLFDVCCLLIVVCCRLMCVVDCCLLSFDVCC